MQTSVHIHFQNLNLRQIWDWHVTIQMKATKHHSPEEQFITLQTVVLIFQSVDEILTCDHLLKKFWPSFPVVLYIMCKR